MLPLSQAEDLSLVGGKARSLNELLKAGFKTQDGFVITTVAFGNMNNKLEQEILYYFDELGAQYVAVRSSAVAEDGKQDAWAGQLETFLNISRSELIDAVKKCWVSIDSARAKSYAAQKNINAGKVAVIVQPMTQSDSAGVAFSAHPVTKNVDQVVIEAGLGLGEAVVSGQITPDTYVIDKKSNEILEKNISIQSKKLVQGKNGKNIWQSLTGGDQQKLTDSQIKDIAEKAVLLEKRYGYPVDIEWMIKGPELFIMQCRPITTLS